MKDSPTIRSVARSARSPRCKRQSSAAPLVTSIALSKPKPTSATLPARNPANKAISPSRLFQAMVKYSRRFPRATARSWFVSALFESIRKHQRIQIALQVEFLFGGLSPGGSHSGAEGGIFEQLDHALGDLLRGSNG